MTIPQDADDSQAAERSVRFSSSRLDCYEQCALRYRFRYIDRIRRPVESIEAFLGHCVHGALEHLYRGVIDGRMPSLEEVLEDFESLWTKGFSEAVTLRGKATAADFKTLGRRALNAYYAAHAPFNEDSTVAVEKKIGFDLEVSGQAIRIEGFLDRLSLAKDGAFEIHDYKTGKTLPTQADVDKDRQLAIYDLAVREAWPDSPGVRLVWHYVRHGKTLVSRRSDEERRALRQELVDLIARIQKEHEFAPQESALCDYCEYRDLCPLFRHGETISAMPELLRGEEAGVKLVDELEKLELKRRELRREIRSLEIEEEAVKANLLRYAEQEKLARVSGSHAQASITEKEELKFPGKTASPERHAELESRLKELPIWPEISQLDAHRLIEGHRNKIWSGPVLNAVEDLLARFARRVAQKIVRLRLGADADA